MKYYICEKCFYRVHPNGKVEFKSGYSNVWIIPQFKTDEDYLKTHGGVEVNEDKTPLGEPRNLP